MEGFPVAALSVSVSAGTLDGSETGVLVIDRDSACGLG